MEKQFDTWKSWKLNFTVLESTGIWLGFKFHNLHNAELGMVAYWEYMKLYFRPNCFPYRYCLFFYKTFIMFLTFFGY